MAPEDETILAVTPLVADEKPLWVMSDAAGRIRRVGGASGDAVTAGIYAVSERARARTPPASLGRLREYLAWLCDAGEPMRARLDRKGRGRGSPGRRAAGGVTTR